MAQGPQCEVCGTELIQGRGRARRTCSHACRQAVYRRNRAAHEAELRRSASPMVQAASDLAAAATEAASLALRGFPVNLTTLSRRYDALMAAAGAAGLMPPIVTRDVPATAVAGTVAPTVTRDDSAAARPEAAAGTVTRDDSAPTKPAPAGKGIEPRPQKLAKKRAAAIIDAAELVRADDYHDTHRWILRSGDTVLGYVEPSYGGASQSGRNGWISRMGGTPGPRCKSRDGAAVDLAARWRRVVTAAPGR